MSKKIIEVKARVSKKLFYNEESMYGVYSFYPVEEAPNIDLDPNFGNFVVNGNTPKLSNGKEYVIEITPSFSKKYGKGYTFVSVHLPRPETISEQQEYVKTLLTEKQYNAIISAYPNEPLLDLIEKDELDLTKIKGIKEATFERIKAKLLDNIEINQVTVELKDLELTPNAIRKLIAYFGGSSAVIEIARNNIYEFCKVDGFGFKTIDKYALNRGDDKHSVNRIRAAVEYTLQKDAELGNSWIKHSSLIDKSVELLGIHEGYVNDFVNSVGSDDKYIYHKDKKFSLRKNYIYEKEIYKKIVKMISSSVNTKVDNIEQKLKQLEIDNGFKYTEEQKSAIKKAVNNNILVINGKAGTGKTTILKGIISILNKYSYISVALSGKAVQVLRDSGLSAKTIHKLLIETGNLDGYGVDGANYKINHDILIIDESSMVNNYLFYKLLTSINEKTKIIIVGDNGQLPSIGTGAIFNDLINYGDVPRQELTIVHRQAQKSGILLSANKIREGEQINPYNSEETKVFGELRDMVLIPTNRNTNIKKIILEIAERNKDIDLFDFQVATGRVDSGELSVKNLNIELQKVFNDINKPYVSRGGYDYRVGDKVIQNGNNYEARIVNYDGTEIEGRDSITEVFNGTLGKIVSIEFDSDNSKKNHRVLISFEGVSDIVEYTVDELGQIGLAYALTVHKLQGSSAKRLVFAFDTSSYMLLSREFIYTGITRASEGCIMIADKQMLHMGIKKSHGNNRKTFLKEMLLENQV